MTLSIHSRAVMLLGAVLTRRDVVRWCNLLSEPAKLVDVIGGVQWASVVHSLGISYRGQFAGQAAMSATDIDFPRLEITMAKGPHYLALFGAGAIAAYLALRGLEAVAPNGPLSSPGGRMISAAALFAIALAAGFKLLSRINFSTIMLTVDREGVYVAPPRGTTTSHSAAMSIPWSSISKIKYYELGRLKETKIIAIELRDAGEVRIHANLLRCRSARELYEDIKRYRRRSPRLPKAMT
ncbi:hypothetical protein AM571_CH01742 [Rhizobium etli 8C-3]|uniref:Uncharacterized protein n=2 Tax=Rhizobium etli TaxID=29449 RepID=A0A1L5P321_RHIET|nr:hypothetical protein AM571_CH01742 [Rhizobium etli 8C-3]